MIIHGLTHLCDERAENVAKPRRVDRWDHHLEVRGVGVVRERLHDILPRAELLFGEVDVDLEESEGGRGFELETRPFEQLPAEVFHFLPSFDPIGSRTSEGVSHRAAQRVIFIHVVRRSKMLTSVSSCCISMFLVHQNTMIRILSSLGRLALEPEKVT